MNLKLTGIALLLMSLVSVAAMADPILFSNEYDVNSSSAYSSMFFNGHQYFQAWTDYDYDGASTITDFHWWGFKSGQGTLDGFHFDIYEDNGVGFPGVNVYTEFVAGDANATLVGDQLSGYEAYKYGIDLANPWSGSAGKYWFSVRAEISDAAGIQDNNWYWGISDSHVFSNDHQYSYDTPGYVSGNPSGGDFAFEISGTSPVPEPATITMLTFGLMGTGLAARRRKAKK